MPQQFLLPDLGEGLTEAEIVEWKVGPGDTVVVDQIVVEVESAKSIVELPVPYAGVVGELHGAAGDVIEAGAPLITIVTADERVGADAPAVGLAAAGHAAAQAAEAGELVPGTALRAEQAAVAAADEAESESGAVLVGYGTRESTVRLRRPAGGRFGRARSTAGAAPAGSPAPAAPVAGGPSAGALIDPERHSRVVSPILRRMALDAGFDASSLVGSGPRGLVIRPDVEAAIAALRRPSESAAAWSAAPAPAAAAPAQQTVPAPVPAGAPAATPAQGDDADVRVPFAGVRKLIGTRLAHSRQTIPEVTLWLEVDTTPLLAAKDRLQAATGQRYSLTTLLARFAIAGLKEYPQLNSSIDESAEVIIQHAAINLGLAAQTARGLMVPVIHCAHDMSTSRLRDEVASVVEHAKAGDYSREQLSGGTFTLNNYGGFGVDGSTPIINPPEVAMLGIGRLIDKPWVVGGEVVVRKVLTLTLVFDHRICDGDVASGFLTYVARCIEEPLLAL